MSNTQLTSDAALASAASKTTVYGWAGSVFGVLADSGVALAVGTVVTIVGFGMNYYFQRRRNQREAHLKSIEEQAILARETRERELHEWAREKHLAEMAQLRGEMNCESNH